MTAHLIPANPQLTSSCPLCYGYLDNKDTQIYSLDLFILKGFDCTVELQIYEGPRDWKNMCAIYIKVLFHVFY